MSYIRQPASEAEIPMLQAVKESFGFIPNFYLSQSARPDLIEAEIKLVDVLLMKDGALGRKEKEYIFLVCSAANLSTYCVTAHCEIVRMLGIEGPEPERIAVDYANAEIPMALKALLHFAAKLNCQPPKVGRRDIDNLRVYGYTDEQIMEAVVVAGLAKFANCISSGLGTAPDFDPSKLSLQQSEPVASQTAADRAG